MTIFHLPLGAVITSADWRFLFAVLTGATRGNIVWDFRASCLLSLYVLMAALPLAAQPVIRAQAGVVNAASYSSPGLPNSGIAQGSVFVVIGKNLVLQR
jgi:hypothetical protein